jgi:hypothetical protein
MLYSGHVLHFYLCTFTINIHVSQHVTSSQLASNFITCRVVVAIFDLHFILKFVSKIIARLPEANFSLDTNNTLLYYTITH